ncbi:hypothetical protein K4K60_009993 [Colletotrichum sp. SAR11_57]|nr:hypothetical protein K4K60_009993 [Colletotrichum sp. SAR11_57]
MTATHPYQQLDIDERVKRVLLKTPLIDGHNDLPQQPRCCFKGKIHNNPKFDFANGFQRGMTDIPRLREGAVGGQFWSVCVPCLRSAENFSTAEYSTMARDAIEQIDLTLRLVESYPETFELVNGPNEVKKIYESGRIACSIGIEGLHMAGNSIGIIRAFYRLGVRYCTLTHVCNNAFADSSTSKVGPVHGGLSKLGRSALVEMNRLGMIVDISHVSEDCAKQVLELSRAPIMFSHSNVKGVFDCARNVPDHILDMVPANGGIVMVTFVPEHVATRRRDAKMEMVLDHLFYIAERIGWDHVGLGSDFDGIASVIPGLEDVKCYPALLKAILDRGATEEQLAKVAGENILRVWRGVEKVRDEMKAEGVLPVEDVWEGREWWKYDGYYQMKVDYNEDSGGDWISRRRNMATKKELMADEPSKALDLLDTAEGEIVDPQEYSALLRKIDFRLMPLLCITYALQSIDRTTLSYAAVFGVREDIGLTGSEFSWAGAVLYLGYLFWEFPTNVLLQKLPVGTFFAATVVLWGAVLMCHGAVHSFPGLAATRFFLGMFEASANPTTMILFSMYYERKEQPLRMGIWIGSAGLGYIAAGIVSFGLGHISGSIASWRILFLFWGSITVAWGALMLIFLPGSPLTTKFLSEKERAMVVNRVKTNGTGVENKEFKWPQFWEAMRDLKTWLLFLFAVASNSPNGGLTTFQGLVIKGMGFSTLQTTLIQMPSGGVQLILCPLACFFASYYPNARLTIMLACLVPFLAGILGLWLIDQSNPYGRLACLWISFAYTATWTLSMSVATANTAGHTKKITTNAMLLIGYCVGNFIGPFFFKTEQAPRYTLGVAMMIFCVGLQIACLAGIWVLLWTRNHSRKTEHAESPENEQQAYERGLLDQTDFENKYFKYVY